MGYPRRISIFIPPIQNLGRALLLCTVAITAWSYRPMPCAGMEEICDNALDDDLDGLVDLNDPDCECAEAEVVSFIPNPSFEDLNCCPFDRSQLDCAEAWIQASEPTTDLIHLCNWLGWPDFPPPMPFPDGEGIMGFRDGRVINGRLEPNWKEYAGACLVNPLQAGVSYRFQFDVGFVSPQRSPAINITFFGTPDCDNLPFGLGNQDFGCPTNGPGWFRLGARLVNGGAGNQWVNTFIEVTPTVDIAAIVIGPDCPAVQSPVSLYYFFDNLLLADLQAFELRPREVSHPCQADFALRYPYNTDGTFQWYKDGIALPGETEAQLDQLYGEGDYLVRVDDGQNCRVSLVYDYRVPVINTLERVTICKDGAYAFGDQLLTAAGQYVDTFKSVDNCDSIVTLNLEVLGELSDTVDVRIFEGETYRYNNRSFRQAGAFPLALTSELGCDSLVLLRLDYYRVYIPNAFSPNDDGVNDQFRIYAEDGSIEQVDLSIYDRWGARLATGMEWDGRVAGEPVNPGVYVYMAKLTMDDGAERVLSGAVMVVK